jgi:Flp pilus assembly protein TadD
MRFHRLIPILLLAAIPALGQVNPGHARCTIRVDVFYASGGHGPERLRVQLIQEMNGAPVGTAVTNSSGTAELSDIDAGDYHVVISGDGIETSNSSTFKVHDWEVFRSQSVSIKTTSQANSVTPGQPKFPKSPTVAANDLNAPPAATKEYDRGNEEMGEKSWSKAAEHFNKAIKIYPQFASAYNNLSVCYGQMGQRDQQRDALQKALDLNDHCVSCLLNLSYMESRDGKKAEAGSLVEKALALEPDNVEALARMAEVDFAEGQYDQAIAAARKAHGMPHKDFAIVHYTAASAFEREGRINDAIAELRMFLQEAPDSPKAETARKALTAMQSQTQ